MTENKNNNNDNNSNNNSKKKEKKREYNPRWRGYSGIAILSLANLASVANVQYNNDDKTRAEWGVSLSFGIATFLLSLLILLFDRTGQLQDKFDLKEKMEGKLEGYILIFFFFFWIAGVAFMTRVGGIAYKAMNIYFSSWATLFLCGYTLDAWSSSKDLISFKELTHLSATLKSWYALFFSSLVVTGSAADAHHELSRINQNDATFAIVVGAVSVVPSLFFILLHYKLVCDCVKIKHGGCIELTVSLLLNVWQVVGLSVLTQYGGIAATITGRACPDEDGKISPGSNLYIFLWASFFSSCFVTLGWKSAQALQFAQAQQRGASTVEEESQAGDNDDDDI